MDKDTVLSWLVEAAKHSEAVIGYMIHNLQLTQVQMDELYALFNGMREDGERQSCWVWTAIDSFTKLWLAVEVGGSESGDGTATGAWSGERAGARSCNDVFD